MTRDEIKAWLKQAGKDRAWLARQCSVSKSTVDGWLAGRPIPKPSLAAIERMVHGEKALSPKVTVNTYAQAQHYAALEGVSLDEWVEIAVHEKLKRDAKKLPARPIP